MTARSRVAGTLCAVAMAGASLLSNPQGLLEEQRVVHITATDATGHLGRLEPADLSVKEGGRQRQVLRVEASTERLRVAVVVDELLAPDGNIRQALLRFIQRLRGSGELALNLVGQRNETRVAYTSDLSPFISAINAFPARATYPGNLVGSLIQIARDQRALEGRRAIVVVAPEIPELSTVKAEGVFDQLRDGAIVFHAATFVGWRTSSGTMVPLPATRLEGGDLTQLVERDRVLGDGPKLSGGLHVSSLRVDGLSAALDRIADELLHEFRVTYLVPPRTTFEGRLSVEATRKGVTVRAPSRVPGR